MKHIAKALFAVFSLCLAVQMANAGNEPHGHTPAARSPGSEKAMSNNEKALQFWEDYYNAFKPWATINWATYYKNNGNNRIQFAPVFVGPTMQWAVPNSNLNGLPAMTLPPSFCQIGPELLAVTVGVGGHGCLYDVDWVTYYNYIMPAMQWAVPNSALNGPPANLSSGMMMMPH